MSSIINILTKATESQPWRQYPANWATDPDGWLPVPPRLEARAAAYAPYCELVIEDGVLVDILPLPRPEPEPPEPTAQEQQRADIDYLAAMAGVQL